MKRAWVKRTRRHYPVWTAYVWDPTGTFNYSDHPTHAEALRAALAAVGLDVPEQHREAP